MGCLKLVRRQLRSVEIPLMSDIQLWVSTSLYTVYLRAHNNPLAEVESSSEGNFDAYTLQILEN